MRRFLWILLLLPLSMFGQTPGRFDIGGPIAGVSSTYSLNGQNYLIALPGVKFNWCEYPANSIQGSPCTNYSPTYTDSTVTTQCPTNQPIVQQGSNICQGTSDKYGNLGVWYDASVPFHSYTITTDTATYGPFVWGGLSGGGGGSGTVTNILTGPGLTGGPITTTGTISIPTAGITPNLGGTGVDSSASNGIAQVNSGTWNFSNIVSTLDVTGNMSVDSNFSLTTYPNGCLNVAAGLVQSTGLPCGGGGGGGSPGGALYNLQTYAVGGVFGGIANITTPAPLAASPNGAPVYAQGVTYVTSAMDWSQSGISTSCSAGSPCTLTLNAGFQGIDVSGNSGFLPACLTPQQCLYQIYISDGANSEAVAINGGTYTAGSGGTVTFIPNFAHPAASTYIARSASSGIQETINIACGFSGNSKAANQCNVIVPGNGGPSSGSNHAINTYNIYGTIYAHIAQGRIRGDGASLNCLGRGPCIQVGNLIWQNSPPVNANSTPSVIISGFTFRAPTNHAADACFAGSQISTTVTTAGITTVTTASAHNCRVGDIIAQLYTDDAQYWGDAVITSVPSSTTYTYAKPKTPSISSQTTPGVMALEYSLILDAGQGTGFYDLALDPLGEAGLFNNFFDMWDDENAVISHFNNNGASTNGNANWLGSAVFSGGAQNLIASQQLAPVIAFRDSTITNIGSCATVLNSNGFYMDNVVCQSTALGQVYTANSTGNFQGARINNIYSESTIALNPSGSPKTPFPGTGIGGWLVGPGTGVAFNVLDGSGGLSGGFATGGSGATPYTYYIVVNCTGTGVGASCPLAGSHSAPLRVLDWLSTGSDSPVVKWPRVANRTDTITYDVIRMTTPAGTDITKPYPYFGGCTGGSGGTCGSVATLISQATACSGGLVCSFTDSGSATTSSYTIKQGTYTGQVNFWPGNLVVVGGNTHPSVKVSLEQGGVNTFGLAGNPAQVATDCTAYGIASSGSFTDCLASDTTPNNAITSQTATFMTDGASSTGAQSATKGRLNFKQTPFSVLYPHHIVTLIDSQPALTESTPTYRPLASVNDVWIGTDVSAGTALNSGRLAMGAPISITDYIANTGSASTGWKRRLDGTKDEFNTPVLLDSTLTISLLSNGCLNVASGVVGSTGSACGAVSSVFGRTGAVVATSGDYTVGQVTGAAPYPSAGIAKSTGSAWATTGFADIVALFGGGTCTGFLQSSGACSSGSGTTWDAIGGATASTTIPNAGFTTTFTQSSNIAWAWQNTTTGTVSTTNASPTFNFTSNSFNGISVADTFSLGSSCAAGTNPTCKFFMTGSGSTGQHQFQPPFGSTSQPSMIGTAGANTGLTLGAASTQPVAFISNTGANSANNVGVYDSGTLQGTISYNTSNSFGFLSQLATGTTYVGAAQAPSTTNTLPLISMGFQAASWAPTVNVIGLNIGTRVATSGDTSPGLVWAPTSGSHTFIAAQITPTINQTGGANGNSTLLLLSPIETALGGQDNALDIGSGGLTGGKFTVQTNGNTTGIGAIDFSGSSLTKLRAAATLTTLANGSIGYDTTNKNWHAFQNSADSYLFGGPVSATYTNGLCAQFSVVSSVITLVPASTACGSGGGGGSPGGLANAFQYNIGGTSFGGVNSPTSNGIYNMVYSVTAGASVAPTVAQVGLGSTSISGASTTYLFAYSDNGATVVHDKAATGTVAYSLPTPATLGNTSFVTSLCNYSVQTDTLTPVTYTINGNPNMNVSPKTCHRIWVDKFNANNWLSTGNGPGIGNVTSAASLTANAPVIGSGSQGIQTVAAMTNGQVLIGSTGVAPVPATLTAGTNVTITNGAGTVTIAATGGGGGSGTVTSVNNTINAGSSSGIFTATGGPVNTTGILNYNVLGTSGGIPYFSTTAVLASSSLLTQYGVIFGGGAGGAPTSSAQGGSNFPLIGQGAANPIFSTIAYPTSATSGAIPCFNSTTTTISSAFLANNGVLIGGGAGACPTSAVGVSFATPTFLINPTQAAGTAPALKVAPTWNNGASLFDAALLVNPTDTASAANSLLADFQDSSVSKFTFDKSGNQVMVGNMTMSTFGTAGIIHNSSAGLFSSSTIATVDIAASAVTSAKVDGSVCAPGSYASQTDGATVTWAVGSVICANATLTFTVHSGSRTLNLTGLVNGGTYILKLIQDATGGESLTGGTGCTWKQKGGGGGTFTLTNSANAIDVLAFTYDGTNCLATLGLAYN